MSSSRKQVLIADAHPTMTASARLLLKDWCDAVVRSDFGLVIVDLSIPKALEENVVRLIKKLRTDCRIAVLNVHDYPAVISDCRTAGADGIVLEREAVNELAPAVEAVLRDESYIPPSLQKSDHRREPTSRRLEQRFRGKSIRSVHVVVKPAGSHVKQRSIFHGPAEGHAVKGRTRNMRRSLMGNFFVFAAMILLWGCSHQPKPSAMESAKGSFDELRTAVGKTVKDPARSGELVRLVGELEQAMMEASEARKAHDARLRSLNANYDATEDDFRTLFREFNEKKKERQEHILAIDERARSLTTDVEWKALSKDVARALEAAAKAEAGL